MPGGGCWLGKMLVDRGMPTHTLLKELAIGILVDYCSPTLDRCLGIGITSAIFQIDGKILLFSELFVMEVIHGEITVVDYTDWYFVDYFCRHGIDFTMCFTIVDYY